MKLSIIIVNYNVQYFLENCLNSVFNAIGNISTEVIVVDNSSVDGSLKMLKSKFPQVKVIANKDNKGFSKANNQAIEIANGEFVLLLNPDTVVEENTFISCINFFEQNTTAGGVGVKMLDGKGNFLPESKRGLPTPIVAFYKIFGLSNLFPKSQRFGQYHLGHLSKEKNHKIEILSGAFMMIRSSTLSKIGLLDESFFMYGEDIDLSYRITKAGYENYYLADTSIIHYKGESTKKSSINYVFVFYRAMAIFAKKHFSHKNAQLFSYLINFAIYLRATFAVFSRTIKHFLLPALDALVIFTCVYLFKEYYETYVKYVSGGAYPPEVETYAIPLIIGIYLISLFFNGAYSIPTKFKRVIRGSFSGSLILLIIYSLLGEDYRFSRAIVLFTVLSSLLIIPLKRYLLHLLNIRRFKKNKIQRVAVVGKQEELSRINNFLKNAPNQAEIIINVNANETTDDQYFSYDAMLYQLVDIIEIYDINEVIFCAKDLSSSEIIKQMARIEDSNVDFKIAPAKSLYIIGSNSIQSSGEYYILSTDTLLRSVNQRRKRIFDFLISFIAILLSPILILINKNKRNYLRNMFLILFGKSSFVGFVPLKEMQDQQLKIKKGILNPADLYTPEQLTLHTSEQLNLEYSRKYTIWRDLEIIIKNIRNLGR